MRRFVLLGLALAATVATGCAAQAGPAYSVSGSIAGPDGGWDFASFDPAGRNVYVARTDSVTVADPAGTTRSIGTIAKGHAVVPIPDQHLLLVTSGHDNSVRLLDPVSGSETARIIVGTDPDAAFYDAGKHRAVVMNAKGGTVSVIDVPSAKVVRTITLKAGLEVGVLGPGDTLFVNNEQADEIDTASLETGAVGGAIAMPGCAGPTGLAYDAASGVLISACANGKAAVVDAAKRRLVKLLDIGMGPDGIILDAQRRLAFVPCGKDAVLTVIALGGDRGPVVAGTIKTELGARSGALDPESGTLYLPTARFNPPVAPATKPTAVPGTFHILVVSPNIK